MSRLLSAPWSLLRRVNLWPRLVVAVSLGFLLLFAVLSVLILRLVDDSRDRILQSRLLIAQMAARQVNSVLEHDFVALERVADSIPNETPSTNSAAMSDQLVGILGNTGDTWLGLYLLDARGNQIAAAPAARMQAPVDLAADPSIGQIAATGQRGVSTPYADGVTGKPAAMLLQPVTASQGGTELILGGLIDVSHAEFLGPLNDAKGLGKTGHAELFDSRGLVIDSTDPVPFLSLGEHRDFYLRMEMAGAEGVDTVPLQPRDAAEAEGEAENHIMAVAHLSSAPWGVAVGGSESETLAPVTDLRNNMLILGAVSLVVLWLVTLVGARLLVRPVRVLTGAADRIAAGDLDTSIRVAEGGEIGRLGETLEAMRLRLRQSLEEISRWGKELETKVDERTGELNARNRELTALTAVATAANESRNLEQMLERCLDIVLEHTTMEAGAVRLLDKENGRLVAAARRGAFGEFPCGERTIALDECSCGHVASTGRPLMGQSAQLGGLTRRPCLAQGFDLAAILPLKSSTGVEGVLYLAQRQGGALEPRDAEMLTVICNQIGVAIENAHLLQDLSKMEAQRQVDTLKSEFISAVSHELRTPLGFIKGYVTTLLREDLTTDPETQQEFLQIINEESDKLQNLIDDLLDASRLHSGGLRLSRKPARVGKIAEQALEKLKTAFPERDFRLHLPPREPEVAVDPWRIEQVVQNLVDNAVKYSPSDSPVTVGVRFEGPEVVVSVRDQGNGIAARESKKIFEPFYRGPDAAVYSAQGTGLGLTICRGIVEAHGGRIWVESKVGKGSTFYFALPLAGDGSDHEKLGIDTTEVGHDPGGAQVPVPKAPPVDPV